MRWKSHVRFGGRAEETGRLKGQHRASVRSDHTAVAMAIAEGAHPRTIQVRVGHASVQITLDRYGHLFPELDRQVAEGLDPHIPRRPTGRRRWPGRWPP